MYSDTAATFTFGSPSHAPLCPASRGDNASPIDERELILEFLPLVASAVARIKRRVPSHVEADDLHSIGVRGLIEAVRKYRPQNAVTFPRFASLRIRGAILDELRRADWCSRRMRMRAREIEAAINDVEQQLGREATPDDISRRLGIDRDEYERQADQLRPVRVVALDSECDEGDGRGTTLHNLLADPATETGRETMERADLSRLLAEHLGRLPERSRKILAMYYFENMRLGEIAAAMGLTESRISQIHRTSLVDLRRWIAAARER